MRLNILTTAKIYQLNTYNKVSAISNLFNRRVPVIASIFWECKNICGTQFSRYLFSARSNMVNYVYYLVCLCFGILGVKYFAYSYISVLFICIRPSGLWTPNNPQSDFSHSCISRRKRRFILRLFRPVATVMFTIDYLGQSSIFFWRIWLLYNIMFCFLL